MKREWKPGDVAMVAYGSGIEAVSVLTDRGDLAPMWIAGDERCWARDGEVTARPLVVIDPEDRDQVERIYRSWCDNLGGPDHEEQIVAMQAAFRSLIAPPKPEEPTSLGAVVEDAEGGLWIRCDETEDNRERPWHGPGQSARGYHNIAAVRVLSEGVTA